MTLRDLIGPQDGIMVAKCEEVSFISEDELQRLRGMDGAANVMTRFELEESMLKGERRREMIAFPYLVILLLLVMTLNHLIS